MKLCICDLDGVIVDTTKRFAVARKSDNSIEWKIAFDPDLVQLDRPITGAREALQHLAKLDYTIVLLSSRPERMMQATQKWLKQYDFEEYELHLKPNNKQFTKTFKWKAEVILGLITTHYQTEEILFIDDEEVNRQAIEELKLPITVKAGLIEYKFYHY